MYLTLSSQARISHEAQEFWLRQGREQVVNEEVAVKWRGESYRLGPAAAKAKHDTIRWRAEPHRETLFDAWECADTRSSVGDDVDD